MDSFISGAIIFIIGAPAYHRHIQQRVSDWFLIKCLIPLNRFDCIAKSMNPTDAFSIVKSGCFDSYWQMINSLSCPWTVNSVRVIDKRRIRCCQICRGSGTDQTTRSWAQRPFFSLVVMMQDTPFGYHSLPYTHYMCWWTWYHLVRNLIRRTVVLLKNEYLLHW